MGLALLLLSLATARAEPIAVLQGLDKTTARISTFEAPLGSAVKFGDLRITARACTKRPPEEPPQTAAYLEIDEIRPGDASGAAHRLFSGWMFKESPALSALEHPVYDIGVFDCKETSGSPSPGKPAGK